MRLIDADALLKNKSDHETISTHLIWNAPTVDAIPIEWIRKHMITHDEVVNGDYYADEAMELNLYVSDLIEKWYAERKEE